MIEPNEEQWERLCDTARKLIAAPPEVVAAENAEDPGNFVKMIDAAFSGLENTKPRVGRGALMVELGLKKADIRDHPERYRETVPNPEPAPSKAAGKVHPRGAIKRAAVAAEKRVEPDEDDQPW